MGSCLSSQNYQRRRCNSKKVGKTRPLYRELPRWRSDVRLTAEQLRRQRDEFWDTAPFYEGRREIWQALRAAAEAHEQNDLALAQALLTGANILTPRGTLHECYDELGARYLLPVYVLSPPTNLLTDEELVKIASTREHRAAEKERHRRRESDGAHGNPQLLSGPSLAPRLGAAASQERSLSGATTSTAQGPPESASASELTSAQVQALSTSGGATASDMGSFEESGPGARDKSAPSRQKPPCKCSCHQNSKPGCLDAEGEACGKVKPDGAPSMFGLFRKSKTRQMREEQRALEEQLDWQGLGKKCKQCKHRSGVAPWTAVEKFKLRIRISESGKEHVIDVRACERIGEAKRKLGALLLAQLMPPLPLPPTAAPALSSGVDEPAPGVGQSKSARIPLQVQVQLEPERQSSPLSLECEPSSMSHSSDEAPSSKPPNPETATQTMATATACSVSSTTTATLPVSVAPINSSQSKLSDNPSPSSFDNSYGTEAQVPSWARPEAQRWIYCGRLLFDHIRIANCRINPDFVILASIVGLPVQ